MKTRTAALALPLALGLGACGDPGAGPEPASRGQTSQQQQTQRGTGLVLDSLTGLAVPLVGQLGDVVIDQAVLTNFALVENAVGQIIGLEANGALQLTGGVLGTNVVTQDFTTTVTVTSSGPGQCQVIMIDLGPISVDALGLATVDVPAATLSGTASGALGSLLCNLGNLLGSLTGGGAVNPGVQGLLNQINSLI
jgi:hypothetical protein